MRRSRRRRRLFNLFSLALLAFSIYLNVFYKDKENMKNSQQAATASVQLEIPTH